MANDQSQGQNSGGTQGSQSNQGVDPKLDAQVREIQKGNDPKEVADIRHIQESRERYVKKIVKGDDHGG
jgi:hypothetical protein